MAADITVVIPARNAAATLDQALGSLAPDKPVIREILVIDDGSADRTVAVARESARRHGLPVEVASVRLGSAGATRNAGIERARGAFIFFLDADDEVTPGSLSLLLSALGSRSGAGLAIGASIRRAKGRPDKIKTPHGYSLDKRRNAHRYLRNELWPIAMGSALVASWATDGIRFPETIGLDEDTCYWTAVLARAEAATIDTPVLLYHHDEDRMARRFITAPRRTFLAIARELDGLAAVGVEREARQWRKAWIAQRIARQLIRHGMFVEAAGMMRAVQAHRELGQNWKALQYRARIRVGRLANRRPPAPDPAARRTLIVSSDPAYPPTSGADLRTFGNALAAAEFGPVCLASVMPSAGLEQPRGHAIRVVSLTTSSDRRSHSLGWGRIKGETRIPRLALTRLKALVREFRPNTIVVESIPLFKLLRPLRPLTGRLILDMHNVESDLAAQAPSGGDPLAMSPDIRRLERKTADIVDRIWVCSKMDRERLQTIVPDTMPVDIVPNGIPRAEDLPATLPPPGIPDGSPTILFVGHLGYGPNVDAAERLARIILPRIREALPGASLILAGRSPDPAVRALSESDGVRLIENPGDTRPLLSAAHLTIVPFKMGGGTRIKILEAMAMGLPVIATPLAAEGLDLADGEDLLLSDTDEGLAELAVALCSDPDRIAALRARAYDTAWSRFGPQAIRDAVGQGLGLDTAGR